MRTNVLNDLSNVVKKGTILAGSWAGVGRILEEGAIEHPLSTHSAPFGTRWKPAGEKGSTRVWKHVAMIFAVLVMSMANVGMAWGVDYSSTPLVSLDFSSSLPTVSGVTYNGASQSSGVISWGGNFSAGTRDVQITFTNTGGSVKLVLGHKTSGSSMSVSYILDSGSTQSITLTKTETSDETIITASAGSHTIKLGPGGSSTRSVITSIAIYDEDAGGGGGGSGYPAGYIYITDVKSTPETGASGVTTSSGSYDTSLDGAFTHTGYSHWFETSSASGYYQLNFSPALDVSGYTDVKIDVWWGVNAGSNRSTTIYVNGTQVGYEKVSSSTRKQVRELVDLSTTATSISSIKLTGGDGGGNSVFFRVGVKGTASSCTAPDHVDISSSTGEFGFFGGETITLTATAYDDSDAEIAAANITGYQWKHNGTNISGATSKTLTINNCTVSNAGDYSCVVSTGATCSTESSSYGTKVYVLQQYIGGETTYNFTRVGTSKVGTVNVTLAASTQREFKIYAGTMTSESYYMGNNGTIDEDASNWDFEGGKNNVKLNPGLGGTFTFTIDYTANGGAPKVSVTYPRKTIYLTPGVWNADGAKFAIHYFRDGGSTGWTDFLTANDCGMSADIPQWNGITVIPVRFNPSDATPGWNGDGHVWNQTNDITLNSNNSIVITGWDASNFTYGTYAVPTYTISYAKGTPAASIDGTKADESKTCGVAFTLPNSAVFTRTGYTQTGWAISDGGSQAYALGGTYTTNEDKTFYPVWTVNNYDLTWNLAGGTTTSAGTGIGSGVSSNTTTSQAFGTALSAPTVTKTGYNFSAWSPSVASTMPAANTTYTATWTAKTTTITINANTSNHGSTTPGNVTATYGSALPSFTAAAGESGYSLTGYFTAATGGNKIINADGTLVASTDYADGSGKWKYETATLTLYAQYEEESGGDCEDLFVCTATSATACTATTGSATYNIASSGGGSCSIGGYSYYIKPNSSNVIVASPKAGSSFAAGDSLIFVVYNPNGTAKTMGFTLASSSTTYTHEVAAGKLHYFRQKLVAADISSGKVSFNRNSGDDRWVEVIIKHCDAPSCTTPTTAFANGAYTVGGSALDLSTLISGKQGSGAITYTVKNANGTGATIAGTSFTATSAGTATVTATQAADGDYCEKVMDATITVSAAPAGQTALVINTLYEVPDMIPSGASLTTGDQFFEGLSANTKFELIGSASNSKTPKVNNDPNNDRTIDGITFDDGSMWFKGVADLSSNIPTTFGLSFIVPEGGGKLYLYFSTADTNIKLAKSGSAGSTLTLTDGYAAVDVTAGTYYLYGTNTSGNYRFYGLKLKCCTTPDAPTAFTAGSITSTGATFNITDAGDAASYDIYYATSSTAPTASTPATTTSTSKTKAVTGLAASTTYYAWVRSVCDADHKSDWVALSGSSFTTEDAAVLNDGCWDPANTAADTLTSGDVSLTTFENNFSDVEGITSVTIQSKGTGNGQSAGSDDSSGYLKVKNATTTKIITIVTTAAKDITIGGEQYSTNTGSFYLVKSTDESTKLAECNTGTTAKATNCPAGTYYVYAKASTKSINFSLLCIEDAAPDVTAPTFVSSVPANGATDVATSGTIVLTFSEALGSVDPSKFTLTGATKGTVTIDGSDAAKVNITYSGAENSSTVTLATAAAAVSDLAGNALAAALSNISFTTAAAAPATKDIYYGAITITAGALTKGSTGTSQFFTNIGGTIANNTEISWSSGPSTASQYYNSNNLTDTELSKSSNWGTSSTSNRYIQGFKFQSGSIYTLALGSKVASSITFYGRNGSESRTMTIGGEEWTSSATKNTHAKHEFIKTGGFTGNVSITQDGDFYGILVITIQTATPCTTPVIPTLSNQSLCEGADIAAWDATVTNASAISDAGETVTYSWKKKGNATELANTATFDLGSSAAESQAGTYVVTVTVSKAGYASSTATKEVTLSVTDGIEVTGITADKATVYPTNSVTLTATASADAAWQWYTCTNAEGAGAAIISGAESASYTIASAGAAGTYYYKAVATGSCGTAERVYTLVVSPAAGGDCFHFVSVIPAGNITVSSNTSLVTPTHATTLEGGTMKVGSSEMTITKDYGLKLESSKYVTVTLDAALEAGNVVIVKGTSGTKGYGITINGVNFYDADNKTFDVSYTVLADDGLVGKTSLNVTKYSGSSYLQEIKITGCGASCTDPEVTASADNTTACVGTSVTFTATDAHASATYQWQKLDGTWTNISGATAATYNIASVTEGDEGKYRVIASHDCNRTSNEVTLNVPVAPNFGSTVPASVSVMQTIALSINTVEASDATSYAWYKSADATWDAGDVEIGTNKELIKAYDGEAIGSSSYYIFCRAQNACGITTSTAIAVNVTAYVEEDCATRGNEGEAEFDFENTSMTSGTYNNETAWSGNQNSKYLTYIAPTGKNFAKATVTIATSGGSNAAYAVYNGSSWTYYNITGMSSSWQEKEFTLPANTTKFQIGRRLDDKGTSSGTFYLHEACFTYTETCTATTVTPSTASVDYEMGDDTWSNPTFSLSPAVGTLTYTSSNEDIASVDDDGTVTFNGDAGTVTITAAYAGGTISATDYCASSGSYTINVSCTGGAPKVVADGSTDMSGCNSSVTLLAKTQLDGDFADGTYQWFRNGEEIDGATSSSYTATQAGTYTVARTNTSGCTTPSTNSAIVTSETTEPEVERLVPFQYYHVDKTYSDQMKMRHLFAVKNSGTLDGKHFKMYVSCNGGAATDVTSSAALVVVPNGDGHVDTVMVDLNKLSGKYNENDELVFTCKAIDCSKNISDVYKNTITMNVIGATPTLALICSGANGDGTRTTSKLVVGGDFLTGYNKADLCQQTGNTTFDANTEWGLYTRLKENYIVTPVNGYAVFNKLNYEPFDILFLTDYPKASKSDAAATILDDMADLCDYRPLFTFKTHMVHKTPSKWAAKGFMATPEVPKQSRLRLNIVCYAHPMFDDLKEVSDQIQKDASDHSQIVYTMLTGPGHESSKGMQGFPIDAAEGFVTIGLVHYDATAADDTPSDGYVTWTPGSSDVMLVAAAERQVNLEARMILFSVNCGAQSKLTETGRQVVLKSLEYLLSDATITPVADCSFTFTNGAGNSMSASEYAAKCPACTGEKGDGKWSTAANWGPDWILQPGKDTEVKIAAPVTVDMPRARVRTVRILEGGSIDIPAGSGLEVGSTIRRLDGTEISPTEINDLKIGASSTGNGTLIFNNNTGDTKAGVAMYSKAFITDFELETEAKNYQYIGSPYVLANAAHNYYDSWLYYWTGTKWKVVKNGGPMTPWTGYCITQEAAGTTYWMDGTLTATGTVDIAVGAGQDMVVGNSWTAPLYIKAFTDDDFENLVGNVYFFNTGIEKDHTLEGNMADGDRYAGSTYVTVPIHAASYTGDSLISSLQGFFVTSNGSAGTLHLDYDRHVRPTKNRNILSGPMHAPKRYADSNEPEVVKIKVSGENYDDRLVLLARADFSAGFDNGWDGDKWDGNEASLYIYSKDERGVENSVSAIPEMEGTVVGFRAGEDEAYTFTFEYLNSDEPLYLFDTENNSYTQIVTGGIYRFFTNDKEKHERFILTRHAPQIATGCENLDGGEGAKAKKLLIEDKMFIMVNGLLYDATGKVVK